MVVVVVNGQWSCSPLEKWSISFGLLDQVTLSSQVLGCQRPTPECLGPIARCSLTTAQVILMYYVRILMCCTRTRVYFTLAIICATHKTRNLDARFGDYYAVYTSDDHRDSST